MATYQRSGIDNLIIAILMTASYQRAVDVEREYSPCIADVLSWGEDLVRYGSRA